MKQNTKTWTQTRLTKIMPKFTILLLILMFSASFISLAQTNYFSKAIATDFDDVNSWGTFTDGSGSTPASISNADNFTISNGSAMVLDANANVRQLTITSGSLTISANTLTVAIASANNSTLLVNGGTLNLSGSGAIALNGNFLMSSGTTNQSGGTITIDGNNNNTTLSSVASGTHLFGFTGGTMNCTAGSITIVDPPCNTISTSTTRAISLSTTASNTAFSGTHTFILGDGSSTTPGNNDGFTIETYGGSGRIPLQNVTVNAGNASGRWGSTSFASSTAWGTHIKGTLTVNTNSEFTVSRVSASANEWMVGSIVNNGTLTTGRATGTPVLNIGRHANLTGYIASSASSISGGGVFRNLNASPTATFSSVIFNNPLGIDIAAAVLTAGSYGGNVSGTVTFTAGRIQLNGGVFVQGISATTVGTTVWTSGGFFNGSFRKWQAAAGTIPTTTHNTTTGMFPFVSSAGSNRNCQLTKSATFASNTGYLQVQHLDASGMATVSLTDGATPNDRQSNATWVVTSTLNGTASTPTYGMRLNGADIFIPLSYTDANYPRIYRSSTYTGTHGAGTQGTGTTPEANRTALSLANLAGTFSITMPSASLGVFTVNSGDWNTGSTWNTGVVPTNSQDVTVLNGHTVTVTSAGATCRTVRINGIVNATAGDLTVESPATSSAVLTVAASTGQFNINGATVNIGTSGATNRFAQLLNSGTFTIGSGTLNVYGNIDNSTTTSFFTQSGGNIIIDPNFGGTAASSATTAALRFQTANVTLSGGTIQFIDPSATAGSIASIEYTPSTSVNASTSHTVQFGDGVSTDAGGNANGFRVLPGTKLALGNVILNTAAGTNRILTNSSAFGILGDLTITAGEHNPGGGIVYVNGNLTNNGILTTNATGFIYLGRFFSNVVSASTNAQTVSGSGVFRNLTTSPTANFGALSINNTNSTGVTFSGATWNNISTSTVAGTLTLVAGKINIGASNSFTLGLSIASAGTLTYTAGGFTEGTFKRYVASSSTISSASGLFPFISNTVSNSNRNFTLTSSAAITTGSLVNVKYLDASGFSPVTPFADLGVDVSNVSNASWQFSHDGIVTGAATLNLAARGDASMPISNFANVRMTGPSAEIFSGFSSVGTGSNTAPIANKTLLTTTELASTTNYTLHFGSPSVIQSIASGAWEDPNSWENSTVPDCNTQVVINSSHVITVNSTPSTSGSLSIASGGSLVVSGSNLTVGCTNNNTSLNNNGSLTISGGLLTINGNLNSAAGSTLNHTSGNVIVDGNDGTNVAANTSVAAGIPIVNIATPNVTFSGGSFTIVDPHKKGGSTDYAFVYNSSSNASASSAHIFNLGNGSSVDTGANGFNINLLAAAGRFIFGKVVVNTSTVGLANTNDPASNKRVVISPTNSVYVLSDFTITSGRYRNSTGFIVGGNLTNNGEFISIGQTVIFALPSGTTSVVNPNAQTVSGTGVYCNNDTVAAGVITAVNPTANFQNITINNSSNGGVSFLNANSLQTTNNEGTVAGTLLLTNGFINTGSNTFTLGVSASSVGTLTNTLGGFTSGSTFARWWGTAIGGATITASTLTSNTSTTGCYPFIGGTIAVPIYKSLFLNQTVASTTGGLISVKLNDGSGMNTISAVTDGVYNINRQSNANWEVSSTGIVGSPLYTMAINAQNLYTPSNSNSRIMTVSASAAGTHQGGTSYVNAQRLAIPLANLNNTYYLGIDNADIANVSIANGTWESTSTWSKGIIPSCNDSVVIFHEVSVNTTGNQCRSIAIVNSPTLGVLTMNTSSELTVGCTNNNASFTIAGGTFDMQDGNLIVNGRFVLTANVAGIFKQSNGTISVDGNSGTLATSIDGHIVDMYSHTALTLQLTGGQFTVVDPTLSATTTNASFKIFPSVAASSGAGWTLKFGNGISTQAGGHASGFLMNLTNTNAFQIGGTLIIDLVSSATNRFVTTSNNIPLNHLTVTSGEYRLSSAHFVKGDISVAGLLTSTSTLTLSDYSGTAGVINTSAQTISGGGTFANLTTSPTASFTSLSINNNNATGITINTPISVSGTLTMTSGIINTDATNFIRLGTLTGAGTFSGIPSATNHVNGPFYRTFASNRTATGTYSTTTLFPVGKGGVSLAAYVDPSTSLSGSVIMKAEAFNTNSGTGGSGVSNLASVQWSVEPSTGSANFTGAFVGITDGASLTSTRKLLQSSLINGTFDGVPGGSLYTASSPNLLNNSVIIPTASFLNYYSYGDLVACSAPGDQATSFVSSYITTTSFTGSFTAAGSNPTGYLVVRYPTGATPVAPSNNTLYAATATLGTGTVLNNFYTAPFSFNVTGLTLSTTYDYYVYSFNNSGCAGPTYNTTSPLMSTVATCAATVSAPTTLFYNQQTTSGFTLNWTASTLPGAEYIIDVATNSTFTNFVIQNSNVGVLTGTPISYAITGLSSGTTYFARVRAKDPGLDCTSSAITNNSIATLCSSTMTSFVENFDATTPGSTATIWPACWAKLTSTGTAYVNSFAAMSSPNALLMGTTRSMVSLPPVSNADAGTHRLRFSGRGNTGTGGIIEIGYLTTPGDTSSFVSFQTYTATSITAIDTIITGSLSLPTGVTTLALRHTGTPATAVYIDNVNYELTPACTGAVAGTISASSTSICLSGSTVLSATGYTAPASTLTYQWQYDATSAAFNSPVDIGSPTSIYVPLNTGTISSTTYYRLKVECGATSTIGYSNVITITVNNPSVVSAPGDSICGPGIINLAAEGSVGTTMNWYDAASGGNLLESEVSPSTYSPSVSSTTNYWVEAALLGSNTITGRTTASAPGTATILSTYGLDFTITSTIVLNSVDVFSSTGTAVTISLYNAGGTTQLQTTGSITTPTNSQNTIPLNWTIAPGTYRLHIPAMTGNYFRENTGPVYPIALSSSGNINGFFSSLTGAVTTSSSYYFMYNWNITPTCASPRTQVIATVTPPPSLSLSPSSTNICVGTTSSTVNATSPTPYTSFTWNPNTNVSGTSSVTFNPSVTTTYTLSASDANGCNNTVTHVVSVNPFPSAVVVNPANTTICLGAPTTLLTASSGISTSLSFTSGTISVAIPDVTATGINNSLAVSGIPVGATIDSIIVTSSITHGFVEDLILNLEAPNGQILNLADGISGTEGANYTNTRFSSDSTKPALPLSGAPYTSTYRADKRTTGFQLTPSPAPTTNLWNNLYGTPNGTWRLRVIDDESIGSGTLTNWQIKIAYTVPTNITWANTAGLYTNQTATTNYTGTATPTVYASPTTTTTYTVTATTAAGCSVTSTASFTVNPLPTVTASASANPLCLGDSLTLTGGGTATSYTWSNGSNTPTNATTFAPTAGTSTYTVTGTDGNSCSATSTVGITVNALPTVTASNVNGCVGSPTALVGSPSGGTFSIADPYTGPSTTYTYTYTDGNGCTASSSSANVTTNALPTVTASASATTLCSGDSLTLTGGGATSYTWSNGTITPTNATQFAVTAGTSTYTVTGTDGNSCSATSTVGITVTNCSVTLNLTAYIQGYYGSANAAVGEMAPVLNNAEMAGEPTIVGSTLTQCDTITVQLRDDTTYAVAYTFKGILNTNGTMSCTFPGAALGNSYYIALQHRNALETWSASPVLISPTSTYNFSTSASQAYNDNQIEVATGKFAIYSGDIERVNGPGVLDFDDSNIWESDYNNFGAMYISTDLNGDGTIDFLDINIWESNYNNFISVQKP